MNISSYVLARQERINNLLAAILPDPLSNDLHSAMHYAVLSGGKRIRPLLVYATGEALGVDLEILDCPAIAIELIHAYSLVHDDLPAMDNDELRRGKPTCHIAFDEATALLAGDALQTLAFAVLSKSNKNLTTTAQLKMIHCLAKAAGSLGMAGGQSLDLKANGQATGVDLEVIHKLKTGALISACIEVAIIASNSSLPLYTENLTTFAEQIGLCFQIQDDILNAEGNIESLGKAVGSDQSNNKATYVTVNGLEPARKALNSSYQIAIEALAPLGEKSNLLSGLADYIVMRDH